MQLYDPQQLAINATSNFTGGPNANAAVANSGSGIADLLLGAAGVTSGLGTTRTSNSIAAQSDGVTPLFNLSNPFPQGVPSPYGNSAGLGIALGQNITGPLHTQDIPYQANWSLDIQRELPFKFVVTAAYVGNVGVHLMTPIQFNQIPEADLALGSKLLNVVSNPFYGIITDPSSTLSLATVQYAQLLRPFPQFLNVRAINVGAGHSSYEAGQLTVEKRFSQGLSVLFGYTFSKAIDNVGEMTSVAGTRNGFQDNYCFVCDRALSDQNQPFAARLAVRYELPFDPLLRIQDMVTRKGSNGVGYGVNQRIGVEEAIKVWTLDGAYATFEEKIKGSITPGKLADFVVLRKDPRKVDSNAIKDIVVDSTYVGGERVWQASRTAVVRSMMLPDTFYGDGDELENLAHDK